MTNTHVEAFVEAFVEAILTDRPPKAFRAAPDDVDVLNVAVQLRASHTEFAGPDPQFVGELGGPGHAYGAMLGAPLIGLATEVSAGYIEPDYKYVIAFVALLVMLGVRPTGLLGKAVA